MLVYLLAEKIRCTKVVKINAENIEAKLWKEEIGVKEGDTRVGWKDFVERDAEKWKGREENFKKEENKKIVSVEKKCKKESSGRMKM